MHLMYICSLVNLLQKFNMFFDQLVPNTSKKSRFLKFFSIKRKKRGEQNYIAYFYNKLYYAETWLVCRF